MSSSSNNVSMEKVLNTLIPEYGLTIKSFFTMSLINLWELGEEFSSKRPSGWQSAVIDAIATKHKVSKEEANKLVIAALRYLCL